MTNIGGPGFFVLVIGLFIAAGTPVLVGSWLLLVRSYDLGVERAFLLVHAAAFGLGLVMVSLWSMPLILEEFSVSAFEYILIFAGTALGIVVLFEALPLGLGILSTERVSEASRPQAAVASAGGWLLGAVLGIAVSAVVAPGFLPLLGAIPGAIVGAAVGGPLLHSRFGPNQPPGPTSPKST